MTDSAERHLDLGARRIPLLVRRSRRARRINLRIDAAEARVELVLPSWVGLAQGLSFAQGNARWVERQLSRVPPRLVFADGVQVPVSGATLTIRHVSDRRGPVTRAGDDLLVGGDPAHVARRVRDWLKGQARRELAALAHEFAARVGRPIAAIRLTDPRTRWGSCSADGTLALSWRLILAPAEICRYVVAHEVAHLAHLNHSMRFWRLVGELVGDVARPRAWLARNGAALLRYG
jgi:predicted metal-dependent hydrolase